MSYIITLLKPCIFFTKLYITLQKSFIHNMLYGIINMYYIGKKVEISVG